MLGGCFCLVRSSFVSILESTSKRYHIRVFLCLTYVTLAEVISTSILLLDMAWCHPLYGHNDIAMCVCPILFTQSPVLAWLHPCLGSCAQCCHEHCSMCLEVHWICAQEWDCWALVFSVYFSWTFILFSFVDLQLSFPPAWGESSFLHSAFSKPCWHVWGDAASDSQFLILTHAEYLFMLHGHFYVTFGKFHLNIMPLFDGLLLISRCISCLYVPGEKFLVGVFVCTC